MLYISSALIGFGMGFINISTATLISEHFQGPDKGRVMGIQAAIQGVGAAAFSVLGGAIADWLEWKWSFLVFLLGIPVLILFAILMPEDQPTKQEKSERTPFLTKNLLILIGIIKLYGTVIYNIQNRGREKKAARNVDLPKAEREPEPEPAAVIEAVPEADDDALIAVISAAVYSMYSSSSVRIKSIRKADTRGSAWRSAGLSDNVRPF
jgi:MFS family permease